MPGVNGKAPRGRARTPNKGAGSEGGEDFTASTTTFQGQALIVPPMIQIRAVRERVADTNAPETKNDVSDP